MSNKDKAGYQRQNERTRNERNEIRDREAFAREDRVRIVPASLEKEYIKSLNHKK